MGLSEVFFVGNSGRNFSSGPKICVWSKYPDGCSKHQLAVAVLRGGEVACMPPKQSGGGGVWHDMRGGHHAMLT